MAITRPISEQISFTSSKTGTHVLDTYLEACEFNNRNLYDILGDIWSSTTGLVDSDSFQLKINTSTRSLQTRMGTFSDPAASWTDVDAAYIFRQKGAHTTSTAYEQLDVVTYNNGTYICDEAHTSSTAAPDGTKFTTILDGTALSTATTSASTSATTATTQATTATTQATAASASATLASEWAEKTSGYVTGTSYSAKYWATQADVATVATNIADISTVAGQATEIGLLGTSDAVADMAILATTDVVADMNTLATADVVADMNTLGTADVVSDMNTLATADIVSDMNILATADVVADMNTLGTADVVSDMNTLATADVVSDMNTLATADIVSDMNTLGTADVVSDMNTLGTAANVTNMATVATDITNVNTTASNITGVNSFAEKYRVQATAPSTSLDSGDLWYDTTLDAMKVYNGSSFVTSAGFASFNTTDMGDVSSTTATNGQVLKYASGSTSYIPASLANTDISGLGGAATLSVGTTAGTVSAGDHNHTGTYEPADAAIQTHLSNTTKHREIDDAASGTTDLWSASKINTQIAAVPDAIVMAIALG
jgi:hypothetical protein